MIKLLCGGDESQYLAPYHPHAVLYLGVDREVLRTKRPQAFNGRVYYLGDLSRRALPFSAVLQRAEKGVTTGEDN